MIALALELGAAFAVAAFCVALVEAIKFERRARAGISPVDAASIGAGVAAVGALDLVGPWAGAAAAVLGTLFFLGLWLDAVLFRVYSIELGAAGVRAIVVPVMYQELSEVSFARDFLRAHAPFLAAPAAVALALVAPSLPVPSAAVIALACAVAVAPMLRLAPAAARRSLAALPLTAAAAGIALWLEHPAVQVAAVASLAAALGMNLRPGASLSKGFVRGRRLPRSPGFSRRPEHEAQLVLLPRPSRSSASRGAAAGSDVLLITVESMGRAYSSLDGGPARMPFMESVAREGVRVRHHFSPCPLTNDSHQVLYGGEYAGIRSPALPLLRAAGYRSVYLTPYRTAHYGLAQLLRRAGFDAVVDRESLENGRDRAMLGRGLALALEPARDAPLFLHVHTANGHLPYVVEDAARFARFDAREDLGRYLNSLEEVDALASDLAEAFCRGRPGRGPPLLVFSGDHGQSFGGLGYRSHGSGIVKEQVNVPFAMRHPSLTRGEVPWASHFDVLPTVLDLLGIDDPRPGFGDSLLADRGLPSLVLWAGRAARSTTSNLGLLLGDRKYMLDLVRGECMELSWEDHARELPGAERAYVQALIAGAFQEVGLR